MVLYLGTYCLKVKGLIYKQLMFMPLTFKQVYHHLTSKVTLSTGAVNSGVKLFFKEYSYFYLQIWLPLAGSLVNLWVWGVNWSYLE